MAVILFKDGKPEVFSVESYKVMLEQGYSFSPDEPKCDCDEPCDDCENTQEIKDLADEVETEDVLLDDEVESDLPVTDEEIRAYAKEMGIKSWHNKGIEKLKKEIAEV